MADSLLEIKEVVKEFPVDRKNLVGKSIRSITAVDGISFEIPKGQTFGLVGESGCGKSTLARCILGLVKPTSGQVIFDGECISGLSDRQIKPYRKDMQMVFQNPYSSFNPRMTIHSSLMEVLRVHKLFKNHENDEIVAAVERVHLPEDFKNRYPHEFSGGQLQRFAIARALLSNPRFVVADEPVSSLDVSVQGQILNLLMELKKELSLTMLFVAHDLSVVEYVSDIVAVMYLGKIVEIARVHDLYNNAQHPYTNALICAIPVANPEKRSERDLLGGETKIITGSITGCRFAPRCKFVHDLCWREEPKLTQIEPEHFCACHLKHISKGKVNEQ